MNALYPGPCVSCGLTNYPLSMGGPVICPACDAGQPPLAAQKAKIASDREVMKTALMALCMARGTWAGVAGWTAIQRRDLDIAIEGLRAAIGDGQSPK